MLKEERIKLRNPITGNEVDEIIKEKEGKERGYFDFQFMLKYLEDENEFVKYFVIDGKKVVVDIAKPMMEYKKKLNLDYERVLESNNKEKVINIPAVSVSVACNLEDETCVSCSG